MKKNKWLIIPIILNLLVFFIIPASAGDEFVSFDFHSPSGVVLRNFPSALFAGGYTTKDNMLRGSFHLTYNNVGTSTVASSTGSNLLYADFKQTTYQIRQADFDDNHNEDFYLALIQAGYGDYITLHTRYVLDYFPTDVLSYFFYRFFDNNYILWSIGIWILAIAFKMIFSTSGVLRCTRGF